MPEQYVYVCALPLYHVFALTVNCLGGMRLGALNVLIANPRDLDGFVKELAKYKFNVIPGVNTLYNTLAENPEFRRLDFSSLRIANGGGMAVQKAVSEKWLALTGVPIIEGYGLSETSPVATCNPVNSTEYSGNIGLPVSSTEIAILDDDGQPVPLGQPGEIAIRGPQVMAGLLAATGRNREGDDAGRLLQVRRHRRHGRARLHEDRRSQEGHDHRLGLQRVPERDRGRDRLASGRARVRSDRRCRRARWRGGQGVRRAQGPGADRGRR